jgi:hypothetical protein
MSRLVDQILNLIPRNVPNRHQIITLDGWNGAGKTTLGQALAASMACQFIDLDKYLDLNKGKFLEALNFASLRVDIETALKQHTSLIIAGCLIDITLKKCGFESDFKIYVLRMSGMISSPIADSIDEYDVLCSEELAEDIIAKLDKSTRSFAEFDGNPIPPNESAVPGLERELIHYHKQYRPHESAALIVEIVRRV